MGTTFVTEVFSSVVQVLLFSLIPFIVWLIIARKKESFFNWIGFKGVGDDKKNVLKYAIGAFVICEVVGFTVNNIFMKEINISQYAGYGIKGLPSAIIYAYIHTALSEEIIFRGFIQKRLQSKLGFRTAAIIQGLLFGLIHVVIGLGQINLVQGLVLMFYPMVPAILIAYVNEKKANGSIIPGCFIHGTLNILVQLSQL